MKACWHTVGTYRYILDQLEQKHSIPYNEKIALPEALTYRFIDLRNFLIVDERIAICSHEKFDFRISNQMTEEDHKGRNKGYMSLYLWQNPENVSQVTSKCKQNNFL